MPKYECLDSNEKILGTIYGKTEKHATDKARKLNPNVVAVRQDPGPRVSTVKEEKPPVKSEDADSEQEG